MKSLFEVFERFEMCAARNFEAMHSRMLPPLKESEIDFYLKKMEIINGDVKEIYTWKNGIPNTGELFTRSYRFCPFGVFPPLQDLVEFYELGKKEQDWSSNFIPLVTTYGGEFLLLQSDSNEANYRKLFLYSPTLGYVDDIISYYDSIESMLETIIQCFQKGAYSYDETKMLLNVDIDLSFKISTRLNTESEYWNDFRE